MANRAGLDRRDHLILVGLSVAVLCGSFILEPPDTPNGPLFLPVSSWRIPLPGMCPSMRFLGISCPGCGLTRSFVATAKGEFAEALVYNPMGIVLFVCCVLQIPYRLVEIFRPGMDSPGWAFVRGCGRALPVVILAGLFLQWLVRLIL